jgi:hypothetical protein
MHLTQSSRYFKDAGMDNVIFWMNPVDKMYTIFSAVLRQQRESDVMTSFDHSDRSAIYYASHSPLSTNGLPFANLMSILNELFFAYEISYFCQVEIQLRRDYCKNKLCEK